MSTEVGVCVCPASIHPLQALLCIIYPPPQKYIFQDFTSFSIFYLKKIIGG